jgi:hypothetical protein
MLGVGRKGVKTQSLAEKLRLVSITVGFLKIKLHLATSAF